MEAIFTIVTKNYVGLAQVLEKSIAQHDNTNFYIFLADELDEESEELNTIKNLVVAKNSIDINEELWQQMSFKYSLVEFCTSIKPKCFEYLFQKKGYSKVVYLDPDIYVFSSLKDTFVDLESTNILLTPHILTMQIEDERDYPEHLLLLNGTFNLGFIGISNSVVSSNFLKWWHSRLVNECFADNDKGTLTDQKWINLLPAFFMNNEYRVSSNSGLNVAPWNFYERAISVTENKYFVSKRSTTDPTHVPLVFVHFSGFNYTELLHNNLVHSNDSLTNFADYKTIFLDYSTAIKNSTFSKYINYKYTYATFQNGINILALHRRLFRRFLNEGVNFKNPFLTTETDSYYGVLLQKKMIDFDSSVADKITNKNIPNFSGKLNKINTVFGFLKWIMGIKKYTLFIRFLKRYTKEENQIFLINKELGKKFGK